MKFFSEVTNRVYDSVDALNAAEKKVADEKRAREEAEAKKKATREARAKEVEAALELASKSRSDALEKLNAFVKDYGAFHTSIKNVDSLFGSENALSTLFDLFNY